MGSGLLSFPTTDFDAHGDFNARAAMPSASNGWRRMEPRRVAAGAISGEFFAHGRRVPTDHHPVMVDTCRGSADHRGRGRSDPIRH